LEGQAMLSNLLSKIKHLTRMCRRSVPFARRGETAGPEAICFPSSRLPIQIEATPPASSTPRFGEPASPSAKWGDGELVLVVDDFQDAREMYAEYLEYAGYRVATATNGADAVEKALSERPNAILMDLSMPLMDGYEATRILKADERTREIPVLALSGQVIGSEPVKNPEAAGCDDFVPKPCLPEDVEQRIRRLLHGRGKP